MDLKPLFQISYLHLHCKDFRNKKQKIKSFLSKHTFRRSENFFTHKGVFNFTNIFSDIFHDEIVDISTVFEKNIKIENTWAVMYGQGDYHIVHNHGSIGYTGILYLELEEDSPKTIYMQPWQNEKDMSLFVEPDVKAGDIVIVPKFIHHYTKPNKTDYKKLVMSFDFKV
jgi:hypothetical protein